MGSITQALAGNKILRINDSEPLGLVQSFDWAPDLGATDVFEFGNLGKVDTAYDLKASGSLGLLSAGNSAGLLARMLPKYTTGAFQGYQYNSGGASGKNGYSFTEADIAQTRFDLIQHERPDQQAFSRSLWFPRCQLATLSGSARADGFAEETYSFQSGDVVGFNTPYHDVRSIPATRTSPTSVTLADTTVATATWTLAYVYVNGRRFRNGTTSDATKCTLGASGVITFTTTEGFTVPADADIHALVYKTTPGTTFPSITAGQRGTSANFVKAESMNIYIAPANAATPTDSEKFLRVQSIDYSIDFGLTELLEINRNDTGNPVYDRLPTLPLNISINATVNETDWKDWKQIMTKGFTTDVYDSTYEFAPATLKTSFSIVIEYWTKSNPAAKLQVWNFRDMAPTSRGTRTAVRGRGEVSWGFRGSAFTLTGFNV